MRRKKQTGGPDGYARSSGGKTIGCAAEWESLQGRGTNNDDRDS